jgi:transcriptional regulator with XRE-family HTH domain
VPVQLGTRIRSRRRQLGLTLKAIGESSQLSVPYLSQVERNQANPTVTALGGIARALGVSLNYFVPDGQPHAVVSRSGEGHDLHIRELPYRVRSLAGNAPGLQLEPLLISVEPGFVSELTAHLGEEFLYMLDGQLTLRVGDEHFLLTSGDSAQHPSTTPHAWENPSDSVTQLLWVGTPKLF